MAISIERYISKNENEVSKWICNLYSKYIFRILSKDERKEVLLSEVCHDERRKHKVLEVLRHLNVISHSVYSEYKKDFSLTVNHEKFLETAHEYAEPFKFEIKVPDKETDRVLGYPTLNNISKKGLIDIYLNLDEYTILDRKEQKKTANMYRGLYSTSVKELRVIRIFPKALESAAERGVFIKSLRNYYEENTSEFVKLMFGFDPDMLINKRDWVSEELRDYSPPSTNNFSELKDFKPESVQKKITETKRALEYYQATLTELEKVQEGLKQYKDFEKAIEEKGGEYLLKNVPLLVNADDEATKKIVGLLLKGSNKGLI